MLGRSVGQMILAKCGAHIAPGEEVKPGAASTASYAAEDNDFRLTDFLQTLVKTGEEAPMADFGVAPLEAASIEVPTSDVFAWLWTETMREYGPGLPTQAVVAASEQAASSESESS